MQQCPDIPPPDPFLAECSANQPVLYFWALDIFFFLGVVFVVHTAKFLKDLSFRKNKKSSNHCSLFLAAFGYLMEERQDPDCRWRCTAICLGQVATQAASQQFLIACRKKIVYHESGQALERSAWRGCGISVLGGVQKSTGSSPDHPHQIGPGLHGG